MLLAIYLVSLYALIMLMGGGGGGGGGHFMTVFNMHAPSAYFSMCMLHYIGTGDPCFADIKYNYYKKFSSGYGTFHFCA